MNAVKTVEYFYALLAQGNSDAAFALLADDVQWRQPGNNRFSGSKRGKAEIGAMFAGMMQACSGTLRISLQGQPMCNGNLVACLIHGTAQREGRALEMTGVDLFAVENGKITQVWLFSDDQAKEDAFWE